MDGEAAFAGLSSSYGDAPFNTVQLVQLRLLITGTDNAVKAKLTSLLGLTPEVEGAFVEVAKKYCAATDDAQRFNCMKEVWQQCRGLKEGHSLHIPPLYDKEPALQTLLGAIFKGVRMREDMSARAFQHSHTVIAEVEGTGKTTIMKAFAIAVAVCCPKFFFVYADYKCKDALQWTPRRLIYELAVRFFAPFEPERFGCTTLRANPELWESLTKLHDAFSVQPGIIADEIQEIVRPSKDPADRDARARIMFELHQFAREYHGTYVILTGSCVTLRQRLFSYDRLDGCDHLPDFNKSLFTFHHVGALRNAESLRRYYEERYGVTLDCHAAETMLFGTGGIGRVIDSCWAEGMIRVYPAPHCESDAWLLPRVRPVSPLYCYKDMGNHFVVVPTLIRAYQAEHSNDVVAKMKAGTLLSPIDVSIPLRSLLNAAPMLSLDRVRGWVEQSLLYIDEDAYGQQNVQLARPCDARLYFDEDTDAEDFKNLVFARIMIHGTRTQVLDAGIHLKALMRPRLWFAPHPNAPTRANTLRIVEGLLYFSMDDGDTCQLLSEANVANLAGKTWNMIGEIGNDAFQFTVESTLLIVWSWQCNGGHLSEQVGGGNAQKAIERLLAIAKSRMADMEDLADALCTDDGETPASTITLPPLQLPANVGGYQAKAAVGICFIIAALLRCLPPPWRVAYKQLYLTISKQDTSTKAAKQQEKDDYVISEELAFATGFPAEVLPRWNTPRKLNTKLALGDDWILDALEPSLKAHWPQYTSAKAI